MIQKTERNDIEIMSPVGSWESLAAAIQANTNAIYFGAENLNMRAQSSINFTLDDLKQIADTCRQHNIKSYLTLNTVIYDSEVEYMQNVINRVKESGISAVIASDQCVIDYARKIGVEVHISTQVNVTNTQAVRYYSQFADVMVLARELNLEQVKAIAENIDKENITGPSGRKIKLEMFVHGALCMAISGKCYLSLHESNYAANRGRCLQTCRKEYVVTEAESNNELLISDSHIMSPKDLCTIHFLNKIIDAGVSVLKIEGRARGPEYVKIVTDCYREAVDAIFENSYNEAKIEEWKNRLATVFNRGFWDGYYLGQKLGEWSHVYGSAATKKKTYIGKVTNYFSNINVAEIKIETGALSVGDEYLIIGPSTGVIEGNVDEIRVNLKPVEQSIKGELCSIKVDTFLRRSDKLYKWE